MNVRKLVYNDQAADAIPSTANNTLFKIDKQLVEYVNGGCQKHQNVSIRITDAEQRVLRKRGLSRRTLTNMSAA